VVVFGGVSFNWGGGGFEPSQPPLGTPLLQGTVSLITGFQRLDERAYPS